METKGRPFVVTLKWTAPEIKLTPANQITDDKIRVVMDRYIKPKFEEQRGRAVEKCTWNGVISYVQQELETMHEPLVHARELSTMRGSGRGTQSFLLMDEPFKNASPRLKAKLMDIIEEIMYTTFEKEALNLDNFFLALEDVIRMIDDREWIYSGGYWQYADDDE